MLYYLHEKNDHSGYSKKAGVSVATVSYIINNRNTEKYTPETKKKVLQIINLYDYKPSRLAQAFASSKSHNIIVALDKQNTVFQKSEYLDFIRMLGDSLEKMQYNLLVKSHLETTRFDTADAIVCLGTEEDMFLRLAQENYVPLLTVDARIHDELFFRYRRILKTLSVRQIKPSVMGIILLYS